MSAPQRFVVDARAVDGDRATLEGDQARQIATVLRLAAGDRVILVQGGTDLEVRLDEVAPAAVRGTVTERRPSAAEPGVRITLALPLLRGDRGEEVIEAVTQLGVARIVPFTSERSVARELSGAKRARWERIARESAETARRGSVPEIAELADWRGLLGALEPPVVVAWERETTRPLRNAVPLGTRAVSIVVGPEGGLTEDEVALARARGAVTTSLGPRNLRSETAAVAAVARLIAMLEARP